MWLIYFFLFAITILLPALVVGLKTKSCTQTTDFNRDNGQILKGVAICLVVMCHFMGNFGNGVVLFTPLGGIGVSIFIFLSAYGLNESWAVNAERCWWRKRIIAVFIPYAIVQIFLFWSQHEFSAVGFLKDVLFIKPQYTYGWYLSYLFVWYILFYGIMRIAFTRKHKLCVVIGLSILMFFFLMKSKQSNLSPSS